MSACDKYQELISRMMDEDLNAEERAAVAEHLQTCRDCAALYAAFSALSNRIGADLEEPPEALHENIMAQIRRADIKKKNRPRLSKPYRNLLAAAACLAVIAGFSLSVEHIFPATGGSSGSAAPAENNAAAADAAAPQIASYGLDDGAFAVDGGEGEFLMTTDLDESVAESREAPVPEPESAMDTEAGCVYIHLGSREQELLTLLAGEEADGAKAGLPERADYVFTAGDMEKIWVYLTDTGLYYQLSGSGEIYLAACTVEQFEEFVSAM